jgi:hypothetical protein
MPESYDSEKFCRGGDPLRVSLTGGADRDRTDDLRLAKPALSQLSYSPRGTEERSVGQGRVELPTSRLSGVRSNHLSYWPRIMEPTEQAPDRMSRSLKTESHQFRIESYRFLAN